MTSIALVDTAPAGFVPGLPAYSAARSVTRTHPGRATSDGAGVSLTRVIGTPMLPMLDPFLMLDDFGSDDPAAYIAGFPTHPHRGFETVTIMRAGRMRHKDSRGHEGVIEGGGVQWMTAGAGIAHSEMPEQEHGLLAGFQLWLNLPAAEKRREPWYDDIKAARIPSVRLASGATALVIAGNVGGVVGPAPQRSTEPLILSIALDAGARAVVPVPAGLAGFIYPYAGMASVGGSRLAHGTIGVLGAGDHVVVSAVGGGEARLLLAAGRPLGEPVMRHGPFVMNTAEEIREAITDWQRGAF